MASAIRVERHTCDTRRIMEQPHLAAEMERVGITADLYLYSAAAPAGTCVYEYGDRYKFVCGSRALFERWARENAFHVIS